MADMIDDEIDDVALEALAVAYATPPPAALRTRIRAAVRGDRSLRVAQRTATRWRVVGTIAAGIALAIGGLLARTTRLADERTLELAELTARLDAQERTLASLREAVAAQVQVLRVLGGPGTQTAALAPQGEHTGRGRVLLDPTTGETAVVVADLEPLAAGRTYELWAIRGNRPPEPAGLFTVGADRVGAARANRVERPGEVTAFAVSIEPAGGSPAPTGPVVLVGPLA